MSHELESIARQALRLAQAHGVSDAECSVSEGDEFEVKVRLGEIETLKEAGSRGAGIRVFLGTCAGSAYTSDLTEEGLQRMVRSAVELARIATEDPFAGLPAAAELGSLEGDLELFSPDVPALDPARRIEMARAAEKAALDFDPRISNSEGASYGSYTGAQAFANTRGFCGSYRASSCSLSVVPVVNEEGQRERDYWYSSSRRLGGLESPAEVGRRAAERALRRLGARKVATQKVPVIFEPRTARSLIGHLFEAVAGESIYRDSSFLAGRLGQTVAAPCVTVIDDATLPGLFGTTPFDDEGVPSRRTPVIEAGTLRNYLLNSYSARKLGLKTTGNASRGLGGNPGTGPGNLYLLAGDSSPDQIISSVKSGFYVTELLGSGVNIVNGDYSRGAAGLWIEDGQLAYPVHEVTIAGNLRRMLEEIEAVGSDLEFRSSIAAPTVLIREMTVSGH